MTRLTTLDLPSFHRATVGFDRIFNELERQFANSQTTSNYPPYNVAEINENEWMITIAVAGFGMDNLDIVLDKNILTVEGTPPKGDEEVKYLHKGIAGRTFRRSFTLADHIEVATKIVADSYKHPIPPEADEFLTTLLNNCFHFLPEDRPSFKQLQVAFAEQNLFRSKKRF